MEDKCDHDLFPSSPYATPSLPAVPKFVKRKMTMTSSSFLPNKENGMLKATLLLSRKGKMEVIMTALPLLPEDGR